MAFDSLRAYVPFMLVGLGIWSTVIFIKLRARTVRNDHALLKASGRIPGDHDLSNADLLLICFNIKKLEDCCGAVAAAPGAPITNGAPSRSVSPAPGGSSYSKPPHAAAWGGPASPGCSSPSAPTHYSSGAPSESSSWTVSAQQPHTYGFTADAPDHGGMYGPQQQSYGHHDEAPTYAPAHGPGDANGMQPGPMYGQQAYEPGSYGAYVAGSSEYGNSATQYGHSASAYSSSGTEYGHSRNEYGYGRSEYRH